MSGILRRLITPRAIKLASNRKINVLQNFRNVISNNAENIWSSSTQRNTNKKRISRLIWPHLIFSAMSYVIYSNLFTPAFISQAHMKDRGRNINNFIADVVDKTGDAVVMVEILNKSFFPGLSVPQSNGSGFVVKEDGLVVTSAHVIMFGKPTGGIKVKFQDGTSYMGTVDKVDLKADLATIRINPTQKLSVIALGSDQDLRPGEWVVAIGSPLALSNTITAGVISAVHRKSQELNLKGKEDMAYIQTDASLTFGNSGGPLVNLDGEVIGVNAMQVAAGISFAVPIRHVKAIIKPSGGKGGYYSFISNPKRCMGVGMLSLSPEIVAELKTYNKLLEERIQEGVLIWYVASNSPAQYAGLQVGDVAVEMNGEKITNTEAIYKELETDMPIKLTIVRNNQHMNVNVEPKLFTL